MSSSDLPFEIHVHGDVLLRSDVTYLQLEEALKPLWTYRGYKSLAKGAASAYEEEPGIRLDEKQHVLHMCWTTAASEDFRHALDEMCMNLNEISASGSAIEVSIFDAEFDDEDDDADEEESRDDFIMLFVGPTPGDIMQVQRNMLVEDVTAVMERHFEKEQLTPLIGEIDKLFQERFNALLASLSISSRPRGSGGGGAGAHGGGRKPRHSH